MQPGVWLRTDDARAALALLRAMLRRWRQDGGLCGWAPVHARFQWELGLRREHGRPTPNLRARASVHLRACSRFHVSVRDLPGRFFARRITRRHTALVVRG